MKRKLLTIACAVMLLLCSAGSTIYAEDESKEEEQTQDVQTTTNEDEEEDRQTADDTKQKLEEISTKVDKVDNQIAQQMVDAETLKEQGAEIKQLKEDIDVLSETVTKMAATVPGYGNSYDLGNPYEATKMIPLRTNIKYYKYVYTHIRWLTGGGKETITFAIVSNSPDLNIVYSETTNAGNKTIGISGIYTENNGELKQPIVGIRFSDTNNAYLNQNDAFELLLNPDNWGYYKAGVSPDVVDRSNYMGFFKRSSTERVTQHMIVPAGANQNDNMNGYEYYTGIAYISDADLTTGAPYRYVQNISHLNDDSDTIELLKDPEPEQAEWNIQELYVPVMVIMSILIIMLFKKH